MISLRVLQAPDGGGDADALRSQLLAGVLHEAGVIAPEPVELRRHCVVCGSTDHGKPEVPAALAGGVHVSLARTRTRTVAAAARGPVGIDVEDVAAVAAHPVADVLLSEAERAAGHPLDAESLTQTWVRKEALLKATGHGLHVPPSAVTLSLPGDGEPRLIAWAGPGEAPRPAEWYEARDAGSLLAAVVLRG